MAFRDLILNNFRRKLFSLLMAILIWSTIHFMEQRHRGFDRTSQQTNLPIFSP
jgi:hypothetical protein